MADINDLQDETSENDEQSGEIESRGIQMEVFAKKADKTGVYAGKFGGKSTQVCVATVEYNGLTIDSVIWMRLATDRNNGSESITTEPGLPTGLKIEDSEFSDRFKEVILMSVEVWFGYKAAHDKAKERLLNPIVAGNTASRRVEVVKR
jgi:hypothetical protein